MTRYLPTGLAILAGCVFVHMAIAQSSELPRETRIKVALITGLIKFVEWPAESRANTEPIYICTWGESLTAAGLQNLQGQRVRDREIWIRKLPLTGSGHDTRGCHVLFVADNVRDVTPAQLYGSGSRALLTVSDMPEFSKRGGIVSLVRQDNRIGFEIHLRYARESSLQIGAPLLALAHVID